MEERNEVVEVSYSFAKLRKKIMYRFIDFLIFVFLAFGLFLSVREIVVNTDGYKKIRAEMDFIMLNSGLYVNEGESLTGVISYYEKQSSMDVRNRVQNVQNAIDKFIHYVGLEAGEETKAKVQNKYDSERLDGNKWNDGQGHPMFVKDGENIVINIDPDSNYPYKSYLRYFEEFYKPFVNEVCQGYLVEYVPAYSSDLNQITIFVFFLEIPIGVFLAAIMTFAVPTFIFRRGRCTIGMLCYKVGRVDSTLLSVKTGRNIAFCSIKIFAIVILSFVTLGAPLFVSFTMMVVTKGKQSFVDYVLGTYEIDTSKNKIYLSKEEAKIDALDTHKEPISFEAVSRLDK